MSYTPIPVESVTRTVTVYLCPTCKKEYAIADAARECHLCVTCAQFPRDKRYSWSQQCVACSCAMKLQVRKDALRKAKKAVEENRRDIASLEKERDRLKTDGLWPKRRKGKTS